MVLSQLLDRASAWSACRRSVWPPAWRAIGVLALLVAFSSSTQDIVVDAWRIEAAANSDELGLLSAAYQFGYRIAILVSEAAILIVGQPLRLADFVHGDGAR